MSILMRRTWAAVRWLVIGVLVSVVLGCANRSTVPTPKTNELGLVARASVREVPLLPTSNSVILAPGESVNRISTLDDAQYLCSNGATLVCDRLNHKLYCFCPIDRLSR